MGSDVNKYRGNEGGLEEMKGMVYAWKTANSLLLIQHSFNVERERERERLLAEEVGGDQTPVFQAKTSELDLMEIQGKYVIKK